MGKAKERLELYQRYRPDDAEWREHLDDTPVEVPTRLKLPQRQVDRVREIVRREMSAAAAAEGFESFEESDDFGLEDEEWVSPYEEVFEPEAVGDGISTPLSSHHSAAKPVEAKPASALAAGAVDTKKVSVDDKEDGTRGVAEAKA